MRNIGPGVIYVEVTGSVSYTHKPSCNLLMSWYGRDNPRTIKVRCEDTLPDEPGWVYVTVIYEGTTTWYVHHREVFTL